jgi:MOSC domain-containing protein YiiM
MSPRLLSLQLAAVRDIEPTGSEEWWDKGWRTGFHKQPWEGPCWMAYGGLRGDECADLRVHGGIDKAVCVYPQEHYAHWRATLPNLDFQHGAFGENFTTHGLLESEACIGDTFRIGEALVQISQPRQPCWKLARRWRVKDLTAQVERTGLTGFYFRVMRHGSVAAGDTFHLEARLQPQWPLSLCNEIMHHRRDDLPAARELSAVPELAGSWKDALWSRAIRAGHENAKAVQ